MNGPDGRSAQAAPLNGLGGSNGPNGLDGDVDEALALANDNRRGPRPGSGGAPAAPAPGPRQTQEAGAPQAPAPAPAAEHHRATSWPAARRLAREAGRRAAEHRARIAVDPDRDTDPPFPANIEGTMGTKGIGAVAGAEGIEGFRSLLEGPAGTRALPRGAVRVPLDQALGLVLATPLTALTDLPSFDTSAMDGWVVAGPGPWVVRDEKILAGHASPASLADGEAATIATGARIPADTTAVIRSEHGHTDDKGQLHPLRRVAHGQDIRPRGQECRSGDLLLPAGGLVTPAVLGLAAAAGYDELAVFPRPRAEVLVLGDELLTSGLPRDGLIRDALGPMLPHWLRALGVEVTAVRRIGDDAKALLKAVRGAKADLVVTTGGTASGPVDHVHPTLRALDAELLVDGVAVRPGHPMLLARIKDGKYLVGLPGNPLAAVSGLLTLAEPLLRALSGRAEDEAPYGAPLHSSVQGHPYDTRLVPVVMRQDSDSGHDWAVPLHYNGPAMLRGIAASDGLAVVPPGGAQEGQEVEILDLPWSWGPATGGSLGVSTSPFKTTGNAAGNAAGHTTGHTAGNAAPSHLGDETRQAAPPNVGAESPHDTMGSATLTTTQSGTQTADNSPGDEGCFT
ncbi:molybdopterin molybdotransferase MoeA [Streptomyces kunmingensis]|uniref:Molybdopterin molybdenumtransferase n=1 Tax=Streptomyces kunmingensis TaxID=68225 RepID=A0ABU6C3A4_9ACTN|nr:molybdopterin molybdotransferase MoeA [Streptomyces kunmingensis]MEB3959208.1 molybdopterin molybdotransferase MoeA [Streptomyces kunmingensis]